MGSLGGFCGWETLIISSATSDGQAKGAVTLSASWNGFATRKRGGLYSVTQGVVLHSRPSAEMRGAAYYIRWSCLPLLY